MMRFFGYVSFNVFCVLLNRIGRLNDIGKFLSKSMCNFLYCNYAPVEGAYWFGYVRVSSASSS